MPRRINPLMPAGVFPENTSPQPRYRTVRARNKSGRALNPGDVLILSVANIASGIPVAVTTTTSAGSPLICGVVPADISTVPDGGDFQMQVAGLHPSVRVDGTTDLAAGDMVASHTTDGAAAKTTDKRLAVGFILAAYTTDAVAAKAVFLINPAGL